MIHENSKTKYVQDASGLKTMYVYDDEGRLVYISNSNNETTFIDYENEVSIDSYIMENGHKVSRKYDFDNNLIYYKDRNGTETWFDHEGNVVKQKEAVHMVDQLSQKDREALIKLLQEGYSFEDVSKALEEMKAEYDLLAEAEKYGWTYICKNRELSAYFMRKHKFKIDWKTASYYQDFTDEMLYEFYAYVDWLAIFLTGDMGKDLLYNVRDTIRNSVLKSYQLYDLHDEIMCSGEEDSTDAYNEMVDRLMKITE